MIRLENVNLLNYIEKFSVLRVKNFLFVEVKNLN